MLAKLILLASSAFGCAPSVAASEPARFVTLGTMGGPLPHAARSQPANVLVSDGNVYVVDAGDGAAGQLAKAGIALGDVDGIFLSHLHADHVSGLGAIIMLRLAGLTTDPIAVYGPPGTRRMVDGIIAAMGPVLETGYGKANVALPDPKAVVRVTEIGNGWSAELGGAKISAVRNTHYGDQVIAQSLAYRFDVKGGSIVYTGDTGPSPAVERLAKGADILFAEMIDVELTLARIRRLNPSLGGPQQDGIAKHLAAQHLAPEQVGDLATRAKVSQVVVTHLVPGSTDEDRLAAYVERIKSRFQGRVQIAKDLDTFEVK